MWASLTKHWFLLALAICFTFGYFGSDSLKPLLMMTTVRSGVVFVVMWAVGITLHADSIRKSVAEPLPSILAITTNVAVVPLMALPALWFLPEKYFGGLFVTAIVPCTLASASVWTRKAAGDDTIAMMTTVVTNVNCVIVVPIGIWLVLSQQAEIDAVAQFRKLAIIVVAPLLLAQAMRRAGLAAWADRNKSRLSTFGQLGILVMVVFGAVTSGTMVDRVGQTAGTWTMLLVLVGTCIVVHLAAFCFGVVVARGMSMSRASQVAIGIAGSQKTLMVGLQIAIDCGVSVIPMLVYHLCQLFLDTVIAERWKRGSAVEETVSRSA